MRLGYLEVSWGCQDPSRPATPLLEGGGLYENVFIQSTFIVYWVKSNLTAHPLTASSCKIWPQYGDMNMRVCVF